MTAEEATGGWVQAPDGRFALLVAGGAPFLDAAFRAHFPAGITGPIAVTLTR